MEGIDILKVILMLIGFCSLLFLAYVTTRYIGGKQNRAMKGTYIKIVETISLGTDKRIHLIKAGKTYALIATTSKTIDFLTSLDLEEETYSPDDEVQETENLFDFKAIFDKYLTSYKKKKETDRSPQEEIVHEATGGRDFKSNLNRLKLIVQKNKFQDKEDGDESTNEK